jgi:hypothetical protein
MTDAEILDRINLGMIDIAVDRAALELGLRGHVVIDITPDDATSYKVAIIDGYNYAGRERTHVGARYIVALINLSHLCYTWDGQETSVGYVHRHWCNVGDNNWTAVVLSRFLNRLAEELAP